MPSKGSGKEHFSWKLLVSIVVVFLLAIGGMTWWWFGRTPAEEVIGDSRDPLIPTQQEQEGARLRYDLRSRDIDVDSLKANEEKYQYHMKQATDLGMMGRNDEAIEAYKQAEKSGVKLDSSFYFSFGLAYEAVNDEANALRYLERSKTLAEQGAYEEDGQKDMILADINAAIDRVKS